LYIGICATNSAHHEYLCHDGHGFISSGASDWNIHLMPLSTVPHEFQTSAFDADSWPPLANDVSIASIRWRSYTVTSKPRAMSARAVVTPVMPDPITAIDDWWRAPTIWRIPPGRRARDRHCILRFALEDDLVAIEEKRSPQVGWDLGQSRPMAEMPARIAAEAGEVGGLHAAEEGWRGLRGSALTSSARV